MSVILALRREKSRACQFKVSLSKTLQRGEKVQGKEKDLHDVVAAAVCYIFWNLAT